jgi:hypothetical protein
MLADWGGARASRPSPHRLSLSLTPTFPRPNPAFRNRRNHRPQLTCNAQPGSLKAVAVKSIQLGQVWRSDQDGQDYLVTKVYSEVFSQFAVLRPAAVTAPDAPTVRVKVAKNPEGALLPGYTFTQDGSF